MTDLPYRTEFPVRFRDHDRLGHVNNSVYATYVEQARVDAFEDAFGDEWSDLNTVLAHLELDYRTPIEGFGTVTVALGIVDVGTSSFETTYELSFEDEVVATASTVQVVVDPETKSSTPVPEEWRTRLERFEV